MNIQKMTNLTEWFDSEVKRWRSGAAIIWTLIFVVPVTFAFSVISSFSPFDLYGWLKQSIMTLIDLMFWTNVLGILVVVFFVARLNIRHYRVAYYVPCTRVKLIWSHLSPLRILHISSHMTCGGVVTWFATKIVGGHYLSLVQPSSENTDVNVLNECHVFIVLHGIFIGAVLCISFFTSGHHVLQFPIIQQTKFFQIKNQLFVLLRTSASRTFRNLKYFYIFYYLFCASTVRAWSSVGSKSSQDNDNSSSSSNVFGLDTIGGLLSPSLAFYTWFCGTFLDFLLSLPNLLYTVYHTEPYEFPIESTYELVQDKCLHEALDCSRHPLLQYLACLDLSRLARFSKQRRQVIFSVTRLGGHPLNWTNISAPCLFQLKDFVHRIVAHNDCPSGQMSVLRAPGSFNPTNSRTQPFGANDASTSTLTPQQNLTHRATGSLSPSMTNGGLPVQGPNTRCQIGFTQGFAKFSEIVKTHPIVRYFVADRPDMLGLRLFSESQKHIWIISGLSHLASASYTEDTFGVVQQTLPEILTILFSLLEALNRHLKQFPVRKHSRADYAAIQSLKMALKEAVKEAVYRIVTTFDSHLNSLPLSADFSRKLAMFRDFKE